MGDLWQDKATGQWFRRVPATEAVVAETGKSWMDVPVKKGVPQSKPNQAKNEKKDRDGIVDTTLDVAELGLDILGSAIDAGMGLIGDIAGGLADLT